MNQETILEVRQRILNSLKAIQHDSDTEKAHIEADKLLCEFIEALGYHSVVEEWRLVDKWYA